MKHDLLFGIKCLCIVRLSVEHEYLISANEIFHAYHNAPWQERNTLVESVCKTQLSGKTYSKEHLTRSGDTYKRRLPIEAAHLSYLSAANYPWKVIMR